MQGTVSDPKMQDLMLYAAKSNSKFGRAAGFSRCAAGPGKTDDPRVRETLTYALRYDSNPGVRLHSLDGLSSL